MKSSPVRNSLSHFHNIVITRTLSVGSAKKKFNNLDCGYFIESIVGSWQNKYWHCVCYQTHLIIMVRKLFPLGRCLYPSPNFLQLIAAIMELIKLILLNLLLLPWGVCGKRYHLRWLSLNTKFCFTCHFMTEYLVYTLTITICERKHCLYNRTWGAVPFNCHDTITLCWIISNRSYTEEFDFHIIAIYIYVCVAA